MRSATDFWTFGSASLMQFRLVLEIGLSMLCALLFPSEALISLGFTALLLLPPPAPPLPFSLVAAYAQAQAEQELPDWNGLARQFIGWTSLETKVGGKRLQKGKKAKAKTRSPIAHWHRDPISWWPPGAWVFGPRKTNHIVVFYSHFLLHLCLKVTLN